VNALAQEMIERIRSSGPIPFAEYMDQALYDERHGYYSGGGERTGWGGDFLTSPELDPAFGALWTRGLERIWEAAGRPARFDVVEIGPGEGGFAAALIDSASGDFADALALTLVELSAARRERQAGRLGSDAVTWIPDLESVDRLDVGCVFLNEVLDNQPVHVLRRNKEVWEELHVGERDGELVEVWAPCDDAGLIESASAISGRGSTIEISPAAEALARSCASIFQRGAVVFVDYGRESHEHGGDSVVTFSSAGVDSLRLDEPGSRDITAHVDWVPIRRALESDGFEVLGPQRQRRVLQALGAAELDRELVERHRADLSAGRGAPAVRALSRRQALRALLDPGGLGHLQVVAGIKGLEPPAFLKEEEDR
jgi:SAM-dependent MidA family methyltransferase